MSCQLLGINIMGWILGKRQRLVGQDGSAWLYMRQATDKRTRVRRRSLCSRNGVACRHSDLPSNLLKLKYFQMNFKRRGGKKGILEGKRGDWWGLLLFGSILAVPGREEKWSSSSPCNGSGLSSASPACIIIVSYRFLSWILVGSWSRTVTHWTKVFGLCGDLILILQFKKHRPNFKKPPWWIHWLQSNLQGKLLWNNRDRVILLIRYWCSVASEKT